MKIYDYNGKKNICGERIREARLKQRIDENNRYISALRNGIEYFPVYSEEWCFCQSALPYQLYLHDILNEMRADI